jgi:hypothetical protein
MSALRVNLVYEGFDSNWSNSFTQLLTRGLEREGVLVHLINLAFLPHGTCVTRIKNAPRCDIWYLASVHEWMLETCAETRIPIVAHSHGGIETGAFCDVAKNVAGSLNISAKLHLLAGLTVNSQSHSDQISNFYGYDHAEVVGFPMDFDRYPHALQLNGERDLICVPGRLEPDKQPTLVASALAPFKDRVVFTTPVKKDSGTHELYDHLVRSGYRVLTGCRGAEYLEVLSRSLVVFSASLADTLNLSVVEGILCGANPVVPNIAVFKEYVFSERYKPYDIQGIRNCVYKALTANSVEHGISHLNYPIVGKRVAGILKKIAGERR